MSLRAKRSGAKQSPDVKHIKDCFGKKRLAMTEKKCSIYDRLQYNYSGCQVQCSRFSVNALKCVQRFASSGYNLQFLSRFMSAYYYPTLNWELLNREPE